MQKKKKKKLSQAKLNLRWLSFIIHYCNLYQHRIELNPYTVPLLIDMLKLHKTSTQLCTRSSSWVFSDLFLKIY